MNNSQGKPLAVTSHLKATTDWAINSSMIQRRHEIGMTFPHPHNATLSDELARAIKPRLTELFQQRQFETCLTLLEQQLAHHNDAWLYYDKGTILAQLGRFHDAIACFEQVIALEPQHTNAYWNLAHVLLTLGLYEQGFALLDAGRHNHLRQAHRSYALPVWHGQVHPHGLRLLLLSEQGLGDTIQFCRYARVLAQQGAHVTLQVQPALVHLCQTLANDVVVIELDDSPANCDYQAMLMSLPAACKTTLSTIPSPDGYLHTDPHLVQQWQHQLGKKTKLRVGLAWRGRAEFPGESTRGLSLSQWLDYLHPDIDYYYLQPSIHPDDQEIWARSGIHFVGDQLHDFAHTAALISQLDLVISTCTSVAHLSAAIGHDTWIMLSHVADWRWLTQRTDSPWYANALLWRQSSPGQWHDPLQQISQRLAARRG
jgi:tetratricopeptide (TPR) repeat protein